MGDIRYVPACRRTLQEDDDRKEKSITSLSKGTDEGAFARGKVLENATFQ